jgi:hypothetical protein
MAEAARVQPDWRSARRDDKEHWWEACEQDSPNTQKLRAVLSFAVPMRILELRQAGGPSQDDYERVRSYVSHPGLFWGEEASWGLDEAGGNKNTLVCHGAEALLFPSDFAADYAREWRRKLADALAVLAFAPSGVTFLGQHFEA